MNIQSVTWNESNDSFTVVDTNGISHGIPDDMGNRHRVMIQEWIDEGNTPEPYVEPEPHWIDKRLANMADGGYGTIGEQLDMQYWDKKNGTDNWEKHIDKVKSDIPKE